MAETLKKAKGTFQEAMAHGILVKKGMIVNRGGEVLTFSPGDIITPTADELNEKVPSELAKQVGIRNYVSNGNLMGGKGLQIFATKKALAAETAKFRANLTKKMRSQAEAIIENQLSHWQSQGRKMSKRLIDKAFEEMSGMYDASITDPIRLGLYEDFGVNTPA